MALFRSIFQGWVFRQRRLLITGLALLLMLVALPALAEESAAPDSAPDITQVVAGSFRLAQVRILGCR